MKREKQCNLKAESERRKQVGEQDVESSLWVKGENERNVFVLRY